MVTNLMGNQFGDQSYSFKMAVFKGVLQASASSPQNVKP